MKDHLGSVIKELQACVEGFEPGALGGDAAMEVFAGFAEVERLAAAGKLLAAGRVAATEVWRRGGWRSAAEWVAHHSGAEVERAKAGLETAGRLDGCPVVAGELRAGRLSEAQAHAITDAVAVRPDAEAALVGFARGSSLRRLREECRKAKTVAESAAEESRAVHRSREFRNWIGRDGAVCFSGRLTPDAGAGFLAAIEDRKASHVKAARREQRREPFGAYAADALVELVTEERRSDAERRSRPQAMVIVHVSYEAMVRGAVADGERCEIRGVGPVPLDAARRLAADSILRVLVTKGAQPMAVTPGLRTIPRALRILIEARDRTCVVPGCDVTRGLQIDHRKGFAVLGPTDLENCAFLCKRHHDMKSYLGYRLAHPADGSWTFTPPDDYLDPEPPDPAVGRTVAVDPWTGRVDGALFGAYPHHRNLVGAATSGTAP